MRSNHEKRMGLPVAGGGTLRFVLLACLLLAASLPALAAHDWNGAQIDWQTYEKGLAAAKAQSKPICMVFFTEWCPHCANYSLVFHDPKVVEKSKQFVMILMDKDQNKEISAQYALDGAYIPRTYFLSAEGKVDPDLHAPREQYKYFYDEKDPASILAGMDAALGKFSGKSGPGSTPAPAGPPKPGTDAGPGRGGARQERTPPPEKPRPASSPADTESPTRDLTYAVFRLKYSAHRRKPLPRNPVGFAGGAGAVGPAPGDGFCSRT